MYKRQGIADSWDDIKKDPDSLGQRIQQLGKSREVLFDSLREASHDNPKACLLYTSMLGNKLSV